MGTTEEIIRQRVEDRERVLAACYEISNGGTDTGFDVDEVVKVSGLDRERASMALDWHCGQGTVRKHTVVYYMLTPEGVDHYEAFVSSTTSRREGQPVAIVQQVFHGPVGVVQNAQGRAANVVQHPSSSGSLAKMVQPIHFEDFSGQQFERLVFAYHLRTGKWRTLEWYGQVGGDLGRDIWGVQENGDTVCIQCVNRSAMKFEKGSDDLDKAVRGPQGQPTVFRIVCRSTVSADMRDRLKKHAEGLGVAQCDIWGGVEFEERLRKDAEPLFKRFVEGVEFPDAPADLAKLVVGESSTHQGRPAPRPTKDAEPQVPAGRGGHGGPAKAGGGGTAIGGHGGRGGVTGSGSGGDGGSAKVDGDGLAMGGEGGDAGQSDRGGKGGRSGFEVRGVPNLHLPDGTWLWDFGRGGEGASPLAPSERTSAQRIANPPRRITEVTRRDIFDTIERGAIAWSGRLDDVEFLSRLYDLRSLPSNDPRHKTAEQDIIQHRVRNEYGSPTWVLWDSRFGLLDGPDDVLLRFLALMLHPTVRSDTANTARIADALNKHLITDGWELFPTTNISGRPVYEPRPLDDKGAPVVVRSDNQPADGMSSVPTNSTDRDFDVAVSFAGEDRALVEPVVRALQQRGIKVFYDKDGQAELWGKNLVDFLHDLYLRRARYCMIFVSEAYAKKTWPTHERRAAQERSFEHPDREYILPVRIDDTGIPGMPDTVGYVHIEEGASRIANLVCQKLGGDVGRANHAADEAPEAQDEPRPESEGTQSDSAAHDPFGGMLTPDNMDPYKGLPSRDNMDPYEGVPRPRRR